MLLISWSSKMFSVISCLTFLIIPALSLGPPGIQGFRGEAGIPGSKGTTHKPYFCA